MLINRVFHTKRCAGCAGHNIVEDERAGDEVFSPAHETRTPKPEARNLAVASRSVGAAALDPERGRR